MSQEIETTLSLPAGEVEVIAPSAAETNLSQIIDLPVEEDVREHPLGNRRRRLKPIRISDALRKEGLDERQIAKMLRLIIERQAPAEHSEEADDKFMAELLMSCFRYYDEGGSRPAASAKLTRAVKLLHNVPRPKRTKKIKRKKAKGS